MLKKEYIATAFHGISKEFPRKRAEGAEICKYVVNKRGIKHGPWPNIPGIGSSDRVSFHVDALVAEAPCLSHASAAIPPSTIPPHLPMYARFLQDFPSFGQ